MKTLVTGANGFIGQHLVRSLVRAGHEVRALAFGTYALHDLDPAALDWRVGDLADPATTQGLVDGVEVVYHLAAIPRNILSKTWDDFWRVNVLGTLYLLRAAQQAGVRRFVFVSTVEAAGFGDGVHPRREEEPPHPVNNYGRSKLEAERLVLQGPWTFESVVARLPMIYGPGTDILVPKLFRMVKRRFYPLIGSGRSLMEFCFVEDAVQGLRLCGEQPAAAGELFYISGQRSYTVREMVAHVAASMGVRVWFVHIPVPLAMLIGLTFEYTAKVFPFWPIVSPATRKPFFTRTTVFWTSHSVDIVSTDKIRARLGYAPAFDIAAGCARTAAWLNTQGIC